MQENSLDIVPSIDETLVAFKEMTLAQSSLVIGVVACLLLWAIPLTRIDRRDVMTKLTYIGFWMAFVTATILSRLTTADEHGIHFLTLLVIAALAWLKWSLPKSGKKLPR